MDEPCVEDESEEPSNGGSTDDDTETDIESADDSA